MKKCYFFIALVVLHLPIRLWGQETTTLCDNATQGESTLVGKIRKISTLNTPIDFSCLELLKLSTMEKLSNHHKDIPLPSTFQMTATESLFRIKTLLEKGVARNIQSLNPPQSLVEYAIQHGFKTMLKIPINSTQKIQNIGLQPQHTEENIQTAQFRSSIQIDDYFNSPYKDINRVLRFTNPKDSDKEESSNLNLLSQLTAGTNIQLTPAQYVFCNSSLYEKYKEIGEEVNTQQQSLTQWLQQNNYIRIFYITTLNLVRSMKDHYSFYQHLDINNLNYYQIIEIPDSLFQLIDPQFQQDLSLLVRSIKYVTFLRSFLYEVSSCYPYTFEEQLTVQNYQPYLSQKEENYANDDSQTNKLRSLSFKYELFTTPLLFLHNMYRQPHTVFETSAIQLSELTHHDLNRRYNGNFIRTALPFKKNPPSQRNKP